MTYDKEYEQTSIIFSILRMVIIGCIATLFLTVNRLTNWDSTGMQQYYAAPLGIFYLPEFTWFAVCGALVAALFVTEIVVLYVKISDYRLSSSFGGKT